QVVVMSAGEIVQVGTPQALFERPQHTFVGYFIGSPGMNFLPCNIDGDRALIGQQQVTLTQAQAAAAAAQPDGDFKLGNRPEFVAIADDPAQGLSAQVRKVANMGEFNLLTMTVAGQEVKMRLSNDHSVPAGEHVAVEFPRQWLCLYCNERLLGDEEAA